MRFNPLPPSMSTLVRRKPSTIGLRTKAASARAIRNLGSSLALKVMVVSLHGFIAATVADFGKAAECSLTPII